MTRLPALRPREVARALERAGFSLRRTTGSHYLYTHPDLPRPVSVPFHPGTIKSGLLREIIKQAGLTREEFLDLL